MNEKPIIFSGEMVRAILEDRKTQTRRVIKPQPFIYEKSHLASQSELIRDWVRKYPCPYGKPGDRLWVRETWEIHQLDGIMPGSKEYPNICYKADMSTRLLIADKVLDLCKEKFSWRSPIFMPRWASRIMLEVVNVRVERLQDISEEDCIAEGIRPFLRSGLFQMKTMYEVPGLVGTYADGQTDVRVCHSAVDGYSELWDSINAKRGYPWSINPWVWVPEFKRIEAS